MDDAISRLRERAQNEATCFALNDECKHLRRQLAECERERDELVAALDEIRRTHYPAGVLAIADATLAKLGADKTGEKCNCCGGNHGDLGTMDCGTYGGY